MVGVQGGIRQPMKPKAKQAEMMEDSITTHLHDSTEIAQRGKRPVRLLPAYMFERPKNETIQPPRFYGPPKNCSDLLRLGYTLNGFYTVTPSSANLSITTNEITKLETVYCSFKQPEGTFNPALVEKRISHLTLDLSSNYARSAGNRAHFHLLRKKHNNSNAKPTFTPIFFDRVLFTLGDVKFEDDNIGKVTFVASIPGVYHFFFTLVMASIPKNATATVSMVLKGSNDINSTDRTADVIASNSSTNNVGNSVVIGATLKLAKGNRIYFVTEEGGGFQIFSASFSGSLLEEL